MHTFLQALIDVLSSIDQIGDILLWALGIFGVHSTLYWILGALFTRKFQPAKVQHKYAICIAARNEASVIGNLLESISLQDYPSDLVTVFVVADNCTDATADIARDHGAVCYERFNTRDATKGYALQFLFDRIERDYGTDSFEGYFIFDADNLLKQDYISRMNDAFDAGQKIVTSYRNTKNFDENWIASSYALHWIRSIRKNHRVRSVLRLATNIQGTGFLFSNIFVKDGWKYTSLTEDRAFTADAVARGYEITYQDAAMFYDEQPVSLRTALRQRLRWSKGHLQAFGETGWALFLNILLGSYKVDPECRKTTRRERFVESLRHRAASFDTLAQLIPSAVINTFFWIFTTLLLTALISANEGLSCQLFSAQGDPVSRILCWLFGPVSLTLQPGWAAFGCSIGVTVALRLIKRTWQYVKKIPIAAYLFFAERKRIIRIPLYKKILYCLTWPVFDIIHRYTSYVALFVRVGWKPIPHDSKVTIRDVVR